MSRDGSDFDLRDFANNGLIEANYLVNGDSSVLSNDNKVLRIMLFRSKAKPSPHSDTAV